LKGSTNKAMEGPMAPGMLSTLCDMLKPPDEDSDSDEDQVYNCLSDYLDVIFGVFKMCNSCVDRG